MAALALRESHLRVLHANRLALKYGVSLVRDILAKKDGPLHSPVGMTTDEIYKLTLKQTPPSNFFNPHISQSKPLTTVPTPKTKGKKRKQPPPPPNPEHPVRSKVFLKKNILQYLAGTQELTKVRAERVLDVSTISKVTKKGKNDPVSKSEEGKATQLVWVWKAAEVVDPAKVKRPPPPKSPNLVQLFDEVRAGEVIPRDIGVGEDFSHLSIRRQRARILDIRRDHTMLKAQDAMNKKLERPGVVKARKIMMERAAKKSRQEQNWENRRSAARKHSARSRK